mmetsp:Transcript_37494/g.74396  ORF Transcript_37494/g.74396 Transcript_37494/m.74396 type:complete len:248 (-) Transcript_37494:627-1370(-)
MFEAMQEPFEATTLKPLFHFQNIVHVTIPRTPFGQLAICLKRWKRGQFRGEISKPGCSCTHSIFLCCTSLHHVFCLCSWVGGYAPHMSNEGLLRQHYLTSAQPAPERLVQVLTAPTSHALVVATGLIPPPPANAQEAARKDRHIGVRRIKPFEVDIPSHVALGLAMATTPLRPGSHIKVCDHGNDNTTIIFRYKGKELTIPTLLRGNMTIKENDDVTRCSLATILLGIDQTLGLIMPYKYDAILYAH